MLAAVGVVRVIVWDNDLRFSFWEGEGMKYLFSIILLYPLYLLFVLAIDMRVESLRPAIVKHAVEVGVETAYDTWEAKYSERETLNNKKRKAKEKALMKYIQKLERMMSE